MNNKESRAFLKGELEFTPQAMMRYIRSRARLATDEDIEDILQNALLLVSTHYDPGHPDAKLAPYCLSACNKAIAQNLERYHKIALKKRNPADQNSSAAGMPAENRDFAPQATDKQLVDASGMSLKTLAPAQSFKEEPSATSQYRTTSLDSLFDAQDNRDAFELFEMEDSVLASAKERNDPATHILLKDLIDQILKQLPTPIHRTCFLLKYVEGFKREDLIECLKMDAKSIDTVDKKIVRTLKAFKEKLDKEN